MKNFLPNTYRLGRIDLVGSDAQDFAHRMFSRNIKRLDEGHPTPSVFLSAEGRIQSFFWVEKIREGLRLAVPLNLLKPTAELIEKYHFAENFKLQMGPDPSVSYELAPDEWRGTHFEFHWDSPAKFGDDLDWELYRIQHLIPIFPNDFDQGTLVFDVGLDDCCDEGKGCYIGQEIVERVRSRAGHGPKRFSLLSSQARLSPGDSLMDSEGKTVAALTSSFWDDSQSFALTSLPSKFETGLSLSLDSGESIQVVKTL